MRSWRNTTDQATDYWSTMLFSVQYTYSILYVYWNYDFLLAKLKWTLLSFLYPSHKHHSIIIINSLLEKNCLLNCGHHNKRRQVHRSMLILISASHPFIILFTLFHTLNTFFFARLPNCSCLLLLSFVFFQLIIFIN